MHDKKEINSTPNEKLIPYEGGPKFGRVLYFNEANRKTGVFSGKADKFSYKTALRCHIVAGMFYL